MSKTLNLVREFRTATTSPYCADGYYNPIYVYRRRQISG